jgi:hypothetical protein
MTLKSKPPSASAPFDPSDAERGMRRALGIGSGAPREKRRFARDGDVPVIMVRGRRENGGELREGSGASAAESAEAAAAALAAEHEARERAERGLAEARGTIRDLQTKLAHMALARDEAAESVRQIESEKQAVEAALAAERGERQKAEDQLRQAASRLASAAQQLVGAQAVPGAEAAGVKPRRGRPPKARPAPQLAGAQAVPGVEAAVKRKRGRPPKVRPALPEVTASPVAKPVAKPAAKRGRPPKAPPLGKPVKWWIKPRPAKK